MNWQKLHNSKRLGAENRIAPENTSRHEYQKDYDRLIFSSPFRRLQNKTQVFPLPKHKLVHNRLTHSLEVASVGRSIGQMVGDTLLAQNPNFNAESKEFYAYQLPTVIASACLAHDIGNPPFGHSGEEAIRAYFGQITGTLAEQFAQLSNNQQQDLLCFEGNANTFRILTHNHLGMHWMSYSTLASVVKYPCTSENGFVKKSPNIAAKKSGFMDQDLASFQAIAAELGLISNNDLNSLFARHPFVFLVEAADDICYRIIDLEDALRLNILTQTEFDDLLLALFEPDLAQKMRLSLQKQPFGNQRMSYLRAMVINILVNGCVKVFFENEQNLLEGKLQKSLIDLLPDTQLLALKKIDEISVQKIYNYKSVVEIEIAGYTVIGGLLDEFLNAINSPNFKKSQKLLLMMPEQFQVQDHNFYQKCLAVVDFISGMTDLFALDLFRKIKGISV